MHYFSILSAVISLAAFFGYINYRWIKIPTTIAISAGSLLISLLLLIGGQWLHTSWQQEVSQWLIALHFRDLLLKGMLSLLLFAGGLTIHLHHLRQCKWEITSLAFLATIASTFLIGGTMYVLLNAIGIQIPLILAFLFGALISPTDPIAVLAIFKEVKAPKRLEITVAGESLFNDGVGIVMFITLYQLAFSTQGASLQSVVSLFIQQAIGGMIYGAGLGWIGAHLLYRINDLKVAILITLALATGGYALSEMLNVSGPLAMVVAGIFVGNHPKLTAPSFQVRSHLEQFWELIDEILNAVLFLLIGLELLVIEPSKQEIMIGLVTIPLVLLFRFLTVGACMHYFKGVLKRKYDKHFIKILSWGGLRGGLAIALALGLPDDPNRNPYYELILTMTYFVVIFSIIVQGLTIKPLAVNSSSSNKL